MSATIRVDGRPVRVLEPACAERACLAVGRYVHRSAAGMSGTSSRTDDDLSCLTWCNRGCPPPDERRRMPPERVHDCDRPRFGSRILSESGPGVRCLGCGQTVPRWVAKAQDVRWLAEFCRKGFPGSAYEQPFRLVADGFPWSVATDDVRIVAVRRRWAFRSPADLPDGAVAVLIRHLWPTRVEGGDWTGFDPAALRAWASTVAPPPCPRSKARRHRRECACDGRGTLPRAAYVLPGLAVDLDLLLPPLDRLAAVLPPCEWVHVKATDCLVVRGDGWRLALMGVQLGGPYAERPRFAPGVLPSEGVAP